MHCRWALKGDSDQVLQNAAKTDPGGYTLVTLYMFHATRLTEVVV